MPEIIAQAHRKHKEQGKHFTDQGVTVAATNPICTCGTETDVVHGISCCPHCDQPCAITGCALCVTYTLTVNRRVTMEHAAERRVNGR